MWHVEDTANVKWFTVQNMLLCSEILRAFLVIYNPQILFGLVSVVKPLTEGGLKGRSFDKQVNNFCQSYIPLSFLVVVNH